MSHLAGDVAAETDRLHDQLREQVLASLPAADDPWYSAQVDALSRGYLQSQPPARVAAALARLRELPDGRAGAWGEYLPESKTIEFTVALDQAHRRGIFARLTGALSSQRMEIHSAEINTLPEDRAIDRFVVSDPHSNGPPPKDRLEEVSRAMVRSLDRAEPPSFSNLWGSDQQRAVGHLSPLDTEVRVDNNTSERYTILDVFTFDRAGLLYRITGTLVDLDLSIAVAKIGTYLDQVVDVFYVTDEAGGKIVDEARLTQIRQRLLQSIEAHESAERVASS